MLKKALVLSGGGTRGVYENGAVKALRALGKDDWSLVTGTSIGALNAVLIVQRDYEQMDRLWSDLVKEDLIIGDIPSDFTWEALFNNAGIRSLLNRYGRGTPSDFSPLYEKIRTMYDPERFHASDIGFGCVAVQLPLLRPVYVTKEMMKENGADWLIASASAYPVFPVHRFEQGEFIDGGYYDNLPVDEALRLGAEEIIAIDLHHRPQHPQYLDRDPVTCIIPTCDTGPFLDFSPETLKRLDFCGYHDVMKKYGRYSGVSYTFEKTELPVWFAEYERELIILENNAGRLDAVSDLLRSDTPVMDRLLEKQYKKHLSREEMFFGILDELMKLCGCDLCRIWTYREAADAVLQVFAGTAFEDYGMPAGFGSVDLRNYFGRADTLKVTGALVHMSLYPEHAVLSQRSVLALYPFERALADFVLKLMYELGGRYE